MSHTQFNPYKTNNLEKSFHAIMQLNVNTIQRWFFSSPEEFFNARHPENVLENTVDILVENSKKNLDYMHELLHIFESNILQPTEHAVKHTSREIKKYQASELNTIKKVAATAKQVMNAKTIKKDTPKKPVTSVQGKEAMKQMVSGKNNKKTVNPAKTNQTKSVGKSDTKIIK